MNLRFYTGLAVIAAAIDAGIGVLYVLLFGPGATIAQPIMPLVQFAHVLSSLLFLLFFIALYRAQAQSPAPPQA